MTKSPHILNTRREVVAALGGTKAVAGLTGRKYMAAANWLLKSATRFPPNTYVVMKDALAAIGKSAPASLWGMVENDRSPPSLGHDKA